MVVLHDKRIHIFFPSSDIIGYALALFMKLVVHTMYMVLFPTRDWWYVNFGVIFNEIVGNEFCVTNTNTWYMTIL